jgi:putative nucleotidyltransferase with HDIG domain
MRSMKKMPGVRRRSFHRWLAPILRAGRGSQRGGVSRAFIAGIQASLVILAAVITFARWYFVDTNENYMIGYPSPRTYQARITTRFLDGALTDESRGMAANQIVNVRVRDRGATRLVTSRISNLRKNGDLSFASTKLESLVRSMPDDVRERVITTAADIAERNYDKAVTKSEQTAVILDSLRNLHLEPAESNVVQQILDALLVPTVTEDTEMTKRLRDDVSSHIPSFTREIQIGSVLVQEGQLVTAETARLLRENGFLAATIPWKHLWFVVAVTFALSLWLAWVGVNQETPPTRGEWVYVVVLLAIVWMAQNVPSRWNFDSMAIVGLSGWLFLTLPPMFAFHIVLGGGLVGYITAFPGINAMVAVGCIICEMAAGSSFVFIKDAASRIKIWGNVFSLGLCVTFTSAFARWGLGLSPSAENVLRNVALGIALSVAWSSLVVAFIPLWEYIFDIISPLRLLEMSHPSQPLLKRLQLEAPGTYHHTVTVGTLAEAVADRLGMNGLLIKTGAYYHDIGKLKRPHYFVENQSFGDNIHDRLAPGDSARMILSHVPDGLRLADEYKLPGRIKDFIAEHHGTTCIGYFYQKAVDADREAGGDGSSVDRDAFCYQGPAPQTPETALMMLADSTDAALKSLKHPLSGRPDIEKLVGDVINSKIMSGQFVDVDFTMKDINNIKNAMSDALMSMYHTREITPLKREEPADAGRA